MAQKGIHDGHFKRLRETALNNFDSMNEHQKLEFILSFISVRKDVNPLAHRLINQFGSIYSIFNTQKFELMKVEGMTDRIATFLTMFPSLFNYYKISKLQPSVYLNSCDKVIEYLASPLEDLDDEQCILLALNDKEKALGYKIIQGKGDSISLDIPSMLSYLLGLNATKCVLLHNHPSGLALPSYDDILTTKNFYMAIKSLNIIINDHLIIGDGRYYSFKMNGFMDLYDAVVYKVHNWIYDVINSTKFKTSIIEYSFNNNFKDYNSIDAMLLSSCVVCNLIDIENSVEIKKDDVLK